MLFEPIASVELLRAELALVSRLLVAALQQMPSQTVHPGVCPAAEGAAEQLLLVRVVFRAGIIKRIIEAGILHQRVVHHWRVVIVDRAPRVLRQ